MKPLTHGRRLRALRERYYALSDASCGDAAVADKLLTVTRAPSRTGEYDFTVSLDNRK